MVICELVNSCAETKPTEHVLIPRLCRLEESSRLGSVWMRLDGDLCGEHGHPLGTDHADLCRIGK
jgi:hypothetical protein